MFGGPVAIHGDSTLVASTSGETYVFDLTSKPSQTPSPMVYPIAEMTGIPTLPPTDSVLCKYTLRDFFAEGENFDYSNQLGGNDQIDKTTRIEVYADKYWGDTVSHASLQSILSFHTLIFIAPSSFTLVGDHSNENYLRNSKKWQWWNPTGNFVLDAKGCTLKASR